MFTQILSTKLFVPPAPSRMVSRTRVVKLLTQGINYKLSLICAPAGFGKTTLVTEWHQAYSEEALTWITLDEDDNQSLRFLRYLTAAFKDFIPENYQTLLNELDQFQPIDVETILTTLLNSLAEYLNQLETSHLFLVLDDYHLILDDSINKAITFMLDYMPPRMHLIITSRFDPPLPLHRWRARNQLLEIRAADLRFNVEEASAFLAYDSTLKQNLSTEDILLLNQRTEGWAVGLQLAMLWLKGHENSAKALQDFSGSNRFVLEYLGEEVLARQPEMVQTFLLKTSILDRFSLNLANTLTGLEWGMEDLAKVEQANLFLVSLDGQGEWFSYHHLFREFLQHLLKKKYPQQLNELYSRASQWFAQAGFIDEAIQYGLLAKDYESIISLINSVRVMLLNRTRHTILGRWLAQIPKSIIYEYPDLALFHCWVNLYNNNYCDDEMALLAAEKGFQANGNNEKLGELFVIRAFSANYQNDLDATIKYATEALKFIPEKDIFMLAGVTLALGRAYLNNGEIAKSFEVITQSRYYNEQAEYVAGQGMCDRELGNIAVLQGNLLEGSNYYLKIIEILKDRPEEPISVYIDLAKVYLEWNKLDRALEYTKTAEEYALKTNSSDFLPMAYLLKAKISLAQQRHDQSQDFLEKAITSLAKRPNRKLHCQIEAFRIQAGLQMGQDDMLEDWYQVALIQYADYNIVWPFFREPEILAFVRVLIARQEFTPALNHLETLEQVATTQGRIDSLIKIYILMVVVAQRQNPGMVTKSLDKALKLAQPGSYIRTFVDEGIAIETLLRARVSSQDSLTTYLTSILAAYKTPDNSGSTPTSLPPTPQSNRSHKFELLTDRELEVITLVASGASNREISEKMVISLPTVKKHLSNVFSKLGVTSRTQLLVRAKELSLI